MKMIRACGCASSGHQLGFLAAADALQVRDPVVEEVVGLTFQRVAAPGDQRVGQFGILIGVVELADPHVAGRVHLGIVGGAVVDADILDLHRPEIELAGRPGVLVAAARAAMVEHRHDQIVLALFGDDPRRHAGDEVIGILPARLLIGAIAPDQRIGEAMRLCPGDRGGVVFRHPRAARRPQPGIDHAVHIRFHDQMHVAPVLFDDVVHRRRIPRLGVLILLLAQIDAELVLVGGGAALLVHRPCIGLVAATDDAIVADRVVFGRIGGNDRQPVDLSFVGHGCSSLRARSTGGRRSARPRPRHRCRRRRPRAARIAAGCWWHAPRPAARRPRHRSASNARGS